MLFSPPASSTHTGLSLARVATIEKNDHSRPLAGTVICCTSVPEEKRTALAAQAEQMGAIHRYDLTLDVTHLIIGSLQSEKYRYVARERPDIRPMTMEWIEAIRDGWVNDVELDMDELEKRHTFPTLQTLRFSMTGCDDAIERNAIAEQVKANGGIYEGDLTKQITHLISFRTEGPKYKAARNWGLKVVSIEWLSDTLERGMILDEKLYDPVIPISERGREAWDRSKPREISVGKRRREESANAEGGKKRLRRSASTRYNSQGSQIWGEIVSGANVAQVNRSGQWETTEHAAPLLRDQGSESTKVTIKKEPLGSNMEKIKPKGIFSGRHFHYYGFPSGRGEILQKHLFSNGAEIHNTMDDLVSAADHNSKIRRIVIVPHDLPMSQHQKLPPSAFLIDVVTVWWLERCLHGKRFLEPRDHVIGQPFKAFPIPGFEGLSISTSAFNGIDLLHVTKAIGLLGAKYSEDMTAQTSVIVSKTLNQIRKDKYDFAQEWKIPIVSASWLWDSIEAGMKLSFHPYRARSKQESLQPIPTTVRDTDHAKTPEIEKKSEISKHEDDKAGPHLLPKTIIEQQVSKATSAVVESKEESTSDGPAALEDKAKPESISRKSEPLSERDVNSSSRTVSTAPAPSDHPASREDYTSAISDLLSKTKSATAQNLPKEAPKMGRRHKRILGRAPSNMSSGSASNSRAASVDTTAHGHAIAAGDEDNDVHASRTANERIEMLMSGNDKAARELESQPPMTQLEYDDPESRVAEQRAMARMLGKNFTPKKAPERTRTLTLNDVEDFGDKPRARRSKR